MATLPIAATAMLSVNRLVDRLENLQASADQRSAAR
jgi:hypothetical protein